ncbi:unnamed protein product, partial [Didymodactylos carnosus]
MWSLSTTPYIIAAVTVGPYPLQTNTSSPLSTCFNCFDTAA